MRYIRPALSLSSILYSSEVFAKSTLAQGVTPDIPWLRIVLSFIFCIAVAVIAILALRAYKGKQGNGLQSIFAKRGRVKSNRIYIAEMRRLNAHADLCVIHFNDQEYLLSVAGSGITVLAQHALSENGTDGTSPEDQSL